ncbi:MAG: orotate phosphoribosyltransferase [Blastocatellia bacterium]
MKPGQVLRHFEQSGALLEGHFLLSSGLHSPNYLQCALALQYPADAGRFGREIAALFADEKIETIASPAIGGLVIGYAVAAALNVRFIWTERQNGLMTLRRGFSLHPEERILVVEDVITTGGSTRECIAGLVAAGGKPVAAASIVDRSGGSAEIGVPRKSLLELDFETFSAENCPLCAAGSVAYKPGSRS